MNVERRAFLRSSALFALIAACNRDALWPSARALRPITPDFFGHMVQGDWVLDDGSLARPVTVYFGVLRLWDSRAVWWKMVDDPAALPANLRYAQTVGARTMFVFGEPPASALVPGKLKMPTMAAWIAFVREIAATDGIDYAELYNEPAEAYWDGSPEELAEYCRVGCAILRAAGKRVLSPSFTSWDSYGYEFFDRFLAAGGGEWCDEIAFHCYCATPDDLKSGIAGLRALLKKYRVEKPIRNTEYNIVSADPSLLRAHMAQSLVIQASLGVVGAVWDPEPTEAANDYTDDTQRLVADLLVGASVGPVSTVGGVSRCVVTGADSIAREVVWSDRTFPSVAAA